MGSDSEKASEVHEQSSKADLRRVVEKSEESSGPRETLQNSLGSVGYRGYRLGHEVGDGRRD